MAGFSIQCSTSSPTLFSSTSKTRSLRSSTPRSIVSISNGILKNREMGMPATLRVSNVATAEVTAEEAKKKAKESQRPVYPFAAIVGQDEMKLCLLLNVIDPKIGGVMIMGDRGTGKSTTVRSLVDLLPDIKVVVGDPFNSDPEDPESMGPEVRDHIAQGHSLPVTTTKITMVDLPLGATEDRVCGTIDIEKALTEGVKAFEPGLLAKANRGILYVDEVNLLDDHLVDVLLDSAASGWNTVEREGISISHPARFILIGSGNPEEGELRPQLLDRFGMHAQVGTVRDAELRVKIHKANQHQSSSPKSHKTFSTTLMEENILSAELIISKWNLNPPQPEPNTLYHDNTREEADKLCEAVNNLQRAMVYFSSNDCSESSKSKSIHLVRAQNLMQTAMKRLEKEFYQILSASSSITEPDSEIAMADLRTIARTMISAGYGRECIKTYVMIRKSIVDEGMYKLGLENLTFSQIQKLDWKVLDFKIQAWVSGSGFVIHTLLTGERILCDHVFDGYDSVREACFAEIAKEAAMHFLVFPELVAKSKKSSEKLFRVLDLFNSISALCVDIESVFSFESTASVRSQASSTFLKLGEAVRFIVSEFETGIQKDASKIVVPGGRIHPLTRYAMNYLVHLSEYEFALSEIYLDFPIQTSSPVLESFFDTSTNSSPSSYNSDSSSVPVRIAWMILVLLCKLDGKAELYKEVALSYLFLANNLKYVVQRVKESKLRQILGEGWITKHDLKVKHYASSYERLGWARVAALVPVSNSPEKIKHFYEAFEEAIRVQREWEVEDEGMKEEIKESVLDIIVPTYRLFYDAHSEINCDMYAPEDVRIKLMDLFSGSSDSYSGYGFGVSRIDYSNGFNSSAVSNQTLGSLLE